jgi:hydrogenase maturation protease
MARVLVIGYGNRSRCDDGIGYRAAERLRESLSRPDVEVLAVHQLTPELMVAISLAQRVIFIDAESEGQPGEIRRRELAAEPAAPFFTHEAGPASLLAGAASLYGSTASGILYTIAGETFDFGEQLTPVVERSLTTLLAMIEDAAVETD